MFVLQMLEGTILLVDDSENDLLLMTHATKAAGVKNRIIQLQNGQEAIDYLSGAGDYNNRQLYPIPCVLITDLKMPKKDGFELLQWMAKNPEFNSIPRIILSASSHARDKTRAAELGACAYFVKPIGLSELVDLMKHLDATWIAKHCPRRSPQDA